MNKEYNIQYNIGSVKYVVNFYNGLKFYNDGSKFFDIETFSNKKKMNEFIKNLESQGYTPEKQEIPGFEGTLDMLDNINIK